MSNKTEFTKIRLRYLREIKPLEQEINARQEYVDILRRNYTALHQNAENQAKALGFCLFCAKEIKSCECIFQA